MNKPRDSEGGTVEQGEVIQRDTRASGKGSEGDKATVKARKSFSQWWKEQRHLGAISRCVPIY